MSPRAVIAKWLIGYTGPRPEQRTLALARADAILADLRAHGYMVGGEPERARAPQVKAFDLVTEWIRELPNHVWLANRIAIAQAERNRALEDAAQWHEEAKTPKYGAEYGLMNEYDRRAVRKNNEAHDFAATAMRALAVPKKEIDHGRCQSAAAAMRERARQAAIAVHDAAMESANIKPAGPLTLEQLKHIHSFLHGKRHAATEIADAIRALSLDDGEPERQEEGWL